MKNANERLAAIYEKRRLDLKAIVEKLNDEHGKGGILRLAEIVGIDDNSLSKMLYEEGKSQKKNITEKTAVLIDQYFPGWNSDEGMPDLGRTLARVILRSEYIALEDAGNVLEPGSTVLIKIPADAMGGLYPAGSFVIVEGVSPKDVTTGTTVLARSPDARLPFFGKYAALVTDGFEVQTAEGLRLSSQAHAVMLLGRVVRCVLNED